MSSANPSDDLPEPKTAKSNHGVTRSKSRQSVQTAAGRLQPHEAEITRLSDIRPVLKLWLNHQDNQLIQMVEEKSGVERENLFYALAGVLVFYLVCGPGAGLLCNLIGFAYPAYQSVIAIRTENKDDDTQWLVYWTTFAFFSLLDFFAETIYSWMPLYWLLKTIFLLYLALPQTYGAHNLYVNYVDPAFDYFNANVLPRLPAVLRG